MNDKIKYKGFIIQGTKSVTSELKYHNKFRKLFKKEKVWN